MNKKTIAPKRLDRVRIAAIAFVAVCAVGLIAYGIYYTRYSTGVVTTAFVEGEHYALLTDAPALDPRAPLVVREYFSYYCVHCRSFDPAVEEWLAAKADDVKFERSPVTFSPVWGVIGQSYFALAATGALNENHTRLFRVIHDSGRQFPTAESVADFVAGHGVDRDTFLAAFNSPDVYRLKNATDLAARTQRVDSVPTVIVADRYRVNLDKVPRAQAFAVVDFLIDKERKARKH